jgi:hypothetical protein
VKFIKAQRIRWLGHAKRMKWSNVEKDDGKKSVHRKKKRTTPCEMDGCCCSGLESNEDKTVDREDKR